VANAKRTPIAYVYQAFFATVTYNSNTSLVAGSCCLTNPKGSEWSNIPAYNLKIRTVNVQQGPAAAMTNKKQDNFEQIHAGNMVNQSALFAIIIKTI
jgi:hypothetical protein